MNEINTHYDTVVVGLGKTGLSCVRYLLKQGLSIAVTDSRNEPPALNTLKNEFPSVPVITGEICVDTLLSADQILLSPGVSLRDKAIKQAIEKGVPVCGDIEIFCQQVKAPVIAISGSNGKSTVTTLVTDMAERSGLKISVGGNLGTPVLDLLDGDVSDLYVLELSSFQLETTFSLNALASTVLNISPDHMDRYHSLSDYAAAKKKIFSGNGLMVINHDDALVDAMADQNRNMITFSIGAPEADNFGLVKESGEVWLCRGDEKILKQSELAIRGEHNTANALAAMALASVVDISRDAMIESLKCFSGLPHRCQFVRTIKNVSWFNDSKATNVGACIAAINGLRDSGPIILIAGGDSKNADLSSLVPVLEHSIKKVLLFGVDAKKIAKVINNKVAYEFVGDMHDAVIHAHELACPGDLVLLAPACASLDMFDNYQHRGDVFMNAVNALGDV